MEDTCHIHGGAAEGGGHHVVLEVPCEAKVGCGERGNSSGDYFQKTRRFTSCKRAWGGLTKNTASVPILGREPGEFAPESESPERQEITDRETKTQTIQT